MATHAGVALELGIIRPSAGGALKMMSPQMEAILIWCQCRTRNYKVCTFKKHWIYYVLKITNIRIGRIFINTFNAQCDFITNFLERSRTSFFEYKIQP